MKKLPIFVCQTKMFMFGSESSRIFPDEFSKKILQAYFQKYSVASVQIDSFNHFCITGIQSIVEQNSKIITPFYEAHFSDVTIGTPTTTDNCNPQPMLPEMARKCDETYEAPIYISVTEINKLEPNPKPKVYPKVMIGKLPIMVGSFFCNLSSLTDEEKDKTECKMDHGGYFIIRGNERVLVSQMRGNYNTVIVSKMKSDEKYSYTAVTRSMSSQTGHSVLLEAMLDANRNSVFFSLQYIKTPIPVAIVLKALGFLEDDEIKNILGLHGPRFKAIVKSIILAGKCCKTREDALNYIGDRHNTTSTTIEKSKRASFAQQIVENEILPHLGITATPKEIAFFLGAMIKKLIRTALTNTRHEDSKDNYMNKRLDTAGPLLYDIFRHAFKKFVQTLTADIEKKKQNFDIDKLIATKSNITMSLRKCLSTGNWSVQKNPTFVKTGVSQILERMSFAATCSHLRRIIIPMGKEGKNTAAREIHPSSIGMVCPCETPEGQRIGLVLALALLTSVTRDIPVVDVKNTLEMVEDIISVEDVEINQLENYTPIYLNGAIVGYCPEPYAIVNELRTLRQQSYLDKEVSIVYDGDDEEIRIFCDEGRFIRPLLTTTKCDSGYNELSLLYDSKLVKNLSQKDYIPDWDKLVKKGYIQYADSSEINNSVLAAYHYMLDKNECDFCEIHPSVILGIIAGSIPFSDHSQSPRNCYQSSMGKQAIGIPMTNFLNGTYTMMNILENAQRPIVSTMISSILGMDDMPSGDNVIVAIASYTAMNAEDSIIVNEGAVQRGLFRRVTFKTKTDVEKKRDTHVTERICIPPKNSPPNVKSSDPNYFMRKNANYKLLDEDGIVKERYSDGTKVQVRKGDVIVGKVISTSSKDGPETLTDGSMVIQEGEEGEVHKVYSIKSSGYVLVKVVIKIVRDLVVGDKLASRAAQKGTVGAIYKQVDMPFCENTGMVPDIIINPLCIPSRMTLNQLLESVMAKYCCLKGVYGDATPFTEQSENIGEKLYEYTKDFMLQQGFDPLGKEAMCNGMSGERMLSDIFIGVTYYQRLKHLVENKKHARARGTVTTLTRQPLEGRSRDGGLRTGEMEVWSIVAHGLSSVIKDRLFYCSDPFQISVCAKCGIITHTYEECQVCKGDTVKLVDFPYAAKLFFQELTALGISTKLKVSCT